MSSNVPTPPVQATVPSGTVIPWEKVEQFVGQLCHDVRNGLNACELQLTFLAEISTDPEAAEEVKGLRTTLAGITKQLQAVRLATGSSKAHPLDYPAADLFEDLRERFGRLHAAVAGRVEWRAEVSGETLVAVDPELTLNAGLELLNNALHFGEAATPVVCAMWEEAGQVVCSVQQTPAEAPGTLPEDWGRAPLTSTRRGAYGLGLFRARRGLEAQGSRLTFRYSPEQRTLTATMTLPAAAPASSR